jgi:peroxiredoxin
MKSKLLVISFLLTSFSLVTKAQEITELPLKAKKSFGVFHAGFGSYGPEAEDNPSKQEIKGIPKNLRNVTRHQITLNGKQQYYQNYLQNKISKEFFEQLKQYLNFEPNTQEFSKAPLRVSVYILKGEDEKGNSVWLADTNTDLDFSDETPRPLLTYSVPLNVSRYEEIAKNAAYVKSQQVIDGKVVEVSHPVAFVKTEDGESAYVSFPSLHTANIKANNRSYELQFSPANFQHYNPKEASVTTMTVTEKVGRGEEESIAIEAELAPGSYFILGDNIYQYVDVDYNKLVVRVRKMKDGKNLRAAQVGFTAPFFQGKDFVSGKEFSIDQLKGKYVLLDFWFTTCAPCIEEFPKLKALTTQYKTDKFEVIGIVAHSKPEQLSGMIEKHGLSWKQVLSDDIAKQHGVTSFPYTLLISPEGKVIRKNLRGEELEKILAELIQ